MSRELAIALRSRATWGVVALAALIVGHGFVLAVDLFSAASRSALTSSLQAKEMDPLLGIVRPTLGGIDLALSLLAPVSATRILSIEKERGSFGALALQVGSTSTVVLRKAVAAACATALLLLPALGCFALYRALGGHIDLLETSVAVLGELLHLFLIVGVSMAAAAWTSSFAQAATIAVAISLTSWMIDSGEGFAALAWLGRAEVWSIERHVAPFARGVVGLGALGWLLTASAGALGVSLIGARCDWPLGRRALVAIPIVVITAGVMAALGGVRRAYDWTEERRASLPPAVVTALRGIHAPIALDVELDRDDSRRRQLEADVVAKLLLARPDAVISFPLDERGSSAFAARDDRYGRIAIRVGGALRETRSTSRKELMTLVLEAAGVPLPDWTMPPYPGFPTVIEGTARRGMLLSAYGLFPLSLLGIGIVLSRKRSGR
jgi:hypothetical protein